MNDFMFAIGPYIAVGALVLIGVGWIAAFIAIIRRAWRGNYSALPNSSPRRSPGVPLNTPEQRAAFFAAHPPLTKERLQAAWLEAKSQRDRRWIEAALSEMESEQAEYRQFPDEALDPAPRDDSLDTDPDLWK